MYFIYGAGFLAVFMIIYSIIEQRFLQVTRYKISSNNLPKKYDGTSFIVLADLHNCSYGINNIRLIRKIERLSPDFILVAGDMIVKDKRSYPSVAFSLLEKLSSKYPVYYGYGNHEQALELSCDSSWLEYKAELEKRGIIFLKNDSIPLSAKFKANNKSNIYNKDNHRSHDKKQLNYEVKQGDIRIIGLTIDSSYFSRFTDMVMDKDYLKNLLPKDIDRDYKILLAHTPDYFDNYMEWGADLVVSGHLHGGLVRLPWIGGVISPQVKLFPKYDAGLFSQDGKNMIVSRGLGSHSIMLRIFNRPEIVSIKLIRENNRNI